MLYLISVLKHIVRSPEFDSVEILDHADPEGKMPENIKSIANNKKAYHDYYVLEDYEAGIELSGTEVKSIRNGSVNIKDAYCYVSNGELYVKGMNISPYEKGNIFNKDPLRIRRLLMHKREIMRLLGKVQQDGCALVPLSIYLKGPRVKIKLALCKGKKLYDKRDAAAEHDSKREIARTLKEKNLRA